MTYTFDELAKRNSFKKEGRPSKLEAIIKKYNAKDKFVFPKGDANSIEIRV